MSAPSRQRVFGAKPAATPSPVTDQAVAPAELHHDDGKLISRTAMSAVFVVASFWTIAAGGVGVDRHRHEALLVHWLGPRGVTLLLALWAISCAMLCAAYLRLLMSGDRLAARAAPNGLAVNGLWGRKLYEWREVAAVRLHITKPRSREIVFIEIERFDGGRHLVSTSTVEGAREEVEIWIQAVQSLLHR